MNVNRRGELWINTKEKPRAAFRVVQGTRIEAGEVEKTDGGSAPSSSHSGGPGKGEERGRRPERGQRRPEAESGEAAAAGGADLVTAFNGLGLALATDPNAEPVTVEIGDGVWWLNQDQRGGVWINGREKSDDRGQPSENGGPSPAEDSSRSSSEGSAANPAAAPLTAVRLLLKPTKTGAFADEAGRLAETLGKSREEFLDTLVGAGLKVPEKAREKPVFVEHAGEIFWLNRSAKDEIWLNAKPSKYSEDGAEKRGPRSRGRKNASVDSAPDAAAAENQAAASDQAV